MRLQVIIQLLMCITIFGICFGQEIACDDRETRIYKCNNGKCISRNHFCNGTSECSDGSDEYTNTTLMDGMMCQTRRFTPVEKHCVLPTAYLCDHEIDCVGGHDECGCNHTFQCDNGDCVLKVSFCDNMEPEFGCLDGTDERLFNRTTREGFQCPVTRTHLRKTCVLPDQYICDGDSDCDFGIDECFCNFTGGKKKGIPLNDVYSNENCFRCLDGSLVIPNIHVCDGIIHCEDLSDECICPETIEKPRPAICDSVCEGPKCGCPGQVECIPKVFSTSNGTSQIQEEKVCIDHTSICDDVFECENHVDETFCPIDNNTFLCYDGNKKIKQHQLCNGPKDCDDGSDELHCHQINDYFCKSYRRFFRDVRDWDNATVTEQEVFIPPNVVLAFDRPFFTHACDGIPLCQGLDDECNNGCPVEHEYCKHVTRGFRCPNSGSLIIGVEICDGKPTCNDIAPEVSVDEFGCPGRFYCHNRGKTRLPIHIPIDGKCNGKQECDDISDELNCSSTTHFYCNDEGSTLFVPIDQVCDGRFRFVRGRRRMPEL
uniref:low-density lipoprotein receptor-related protein 1B-like n=1 Tax=Styela clava TaxID=7725 RepID=UPI00193AD949|nr:low-density lipoprotein receptor-related protein 1B-like [Styela clava]